MAAAQTSPSGSPLGGGMAFGSRKQARRSSAWLYGGAAVGLGLIALFLWPTQEISQRPHDMKTTTVILPPPPPPPPPETKPVEQPPEPTTAPPLEQPVDTPPPEASSDPAPADSGLTAREGAGPSSYGLGVGDGSGAPRIGRPAGAGGNAFAAYASHAQSCVQRAAQADRELARGRYSARVEVAFDGDGRIRTVRTLGGDDARRDSRIQQVLTGLQCSQRPPAGMPSVRLEISTRSGA